MAFEKLIGKSVQSNPEARIEGVLVQEMLEPGLEVMVGVKKDPVFGPVVAVGLGGVFVEIFEDLVTRVAPLSEEEARAMLDDLAGKEILKGARGQKPRDMEALVDVIVKVSWLALDLEVYIEELDLNPIFVYEDGKGAVTADALILGGRNK